jgi:hypothetical protein
VDGVFFKQLMGATNVCGLAQHLAQHLNRNSQYDLDEPFVDKEYHSIDYRSSVVQLQHSDLQINQDGTQSGSQPFSVWSVRSVLNKLLPRY